MLNEAGANGRGALLTVVLVLKGIASLVIMFTSILFLRLQGHIDDEDPGSTLLRKLFLFGLVAGVAELSGVLGTWLYKRWGVYLLAIGSMFTLVVMLKTEARFQLLVHIAVVSAAAFAIQKRWERFD